MADSGANTETTEGNSVPKAPTVRPGHEVIRRYLRNLEGSPGVYRMLDARGNVLYVGKARNLKKRVASYAKLTGVSDHLEPTQRFARLTCARPDVVHRRGTKAAR